MRKAELSGDRIRSTFPKTGDVPNTGNPSKCAKPPKIVNQGVLDTEFALLV